LRTSAQSWEKKNRIIISQTQLPTTFIRIHLSKAGHSIKLLHDGFYKVEKANSPPAVEPHLHPVQKPVEVSVIWGEPSP
jgi:hypothetical protein